MRMPTLSELFPSKRAALAARRVVEKLIKIHPVPLPTAGFTVPERGALRALESAKFIAYSRVGWYLVSPPL